MPLTACHIGILKDIEANKVDLDEIGDWMRDQLKEIIFQDGPLLIDSTGPSVFLTRAGKAALTSAEGTAAQAPFKTALEQEK